MTMTPKQMAEAWFDEVWNQGKRDRACELFCAAEGQVHGLGPTTMGLEEWLAQYDFYREVLGEIHFELGEVIETDNEVAGTCKVTAVHKVSGKPIEISGMFLLRCRDGIMKEAWNAFDFLPMLVQLGALPEDGMLKALAGR